MYHAEICAVNYCPMSVIDIEKRIRKRHNGDCLIGRFSSNPFPMFKDIRGFEGEVIDISDLMSEEINIPYPAGGLVENAFYQFQWTVDKDTRSFRVTSAPELVDNDVFLQRLLDINLKKTGGDLAQAVQDQALASDEITGAQHTYLYELLQNANDYPYCRQDVKVKFILTDNYLFFLHTGAEFDLLNIVGICSRHQGQKADKVGTIGYKGIGFKTVFVKNNYVYLETGSWSLRFDKEHSSEEKGGGDTPWTIMPWPTSQSELDSEVKDVLAGLDEEWRVRFALRHSDDARQHIMQLDKVFGNDEILLFIPNVTDVEVLVDGAVSHHVRKDRTKWETKSFENPVSDELKEWVKQDRKNGGKTPKKFENIQAIQISFAIPKEGKVILPMELKNTRVYNYLPTELSIGLPFFINADFIPDASRSGLHPGLQWNETVMKECGRRFVDWFASLLRVEGEYDMASVFSMYPTNQTTDNFTSLFMNGMNTAVGKVGCIPVKKDGIYSVRCINDIVFDSTGLTGGDSPILSDEEFYSLTGINGFLPHPDCRSHEKLRKILKDHGASTIRFGWEELGRLVKKPEFKEWLKVRENNEKFLKHLLESGYIGNFASDQIILREDGGLGKASDMFLDVDKYSEDLSFLSAFLPRMDVKERSNMSSVRGWNDFKGKFKTFSSYFFIKDEVLFYFKFNGDAERTKLFNNLENSAKFFHFMAISGYESEVPSNYPVYDEDGNLPGRSNLYVKDEFGASFKTRPWIKAEWVYFVNPKYFERDEIKVKQFFFRNQVKNLTQETACSSFLGDDKRILHIAEKVNADLDSNLAFYRFYSTLDGVSPKIDGEARKVLKVFTTDGENIMASSIRETIYYRNSEWEAVRKEPWLPKDIGRALADEYMKDAATDSIRSFFSSKSVVQQFSMSGFYSGTISCHLDEIFKMIDDKESSRSFLDFIFRNNKTFFKEEVPSSTFKEIPVFLQGADNPTTSKTEGGIFYHTEELDELLAQPWYMAGSLVVLDESYNDIFDGKERLDFFRSIGLRKLDIKQFIVEKVFVEINSYCSILEDRDVNISFHRYFSDKQNLFTDEECRCLKDFPIYISSPDSEGGILSESSSNHYLPTDALTDFISKDLVPQDIFDSVNPDYVQNDADRRYLLKIGNVEIDDIGFVSYITSEGNIDSVSEYLSSEKDRNVRFWRWACDTKVSPEDKNSLKKLPVLIKGSDDVYVTTEKTFLPDEYTDNEGEEELVNQFITDAQFISPDYKEEDDERNWKVFFQALGVTVGGRDIVFRKVLPNLADEQYRRTSIIPLLAGYYEDIQLRIRRDERLKSELACLQLKCVDGEYRIPEYTWISGRFFDIEYTSFSDVNPGYFVSEEYLNQENPKVLRNVKDFMKLLADIYDVSCDTRTKIRDVKIKYYLENQTDYSNDREMHDRIIRDLADAYADDKVGVHAKLAEKDAPELNVFSMDGQFMDARELTLSSAYNPECDFMAGGVDNIDYVDEGYALLSANMRMFLVDEAGVIDGFGRTDIEYLAYPKFSEYFWTQYAPLHESELKSILTLDNLKDKQCMPTITGVKRPCELYDYRISDLNTMIGRIYKEGTDKLPSVRLPKWMERNYTEVGFRPVLYIDDCIRYLLLETNDYRRKVISWITGTDGRIIEAHRAEIDGFLKTANWQNGKKEWVPLSSLVALEKDNNTLDAYFKSNAHVCSPSYMPDYKTDYNRLCDIFKITVISDDDFDKKPAGNHYRDEEAVVEIKKRLAYLAFASGKENWQELYQGYSDKLDQTDIRRCEKILYTYNDNISTDLKVYKDSVDKLWYTKTWDGAPMGDIITWLIGALNLKDGLKLTEGLIQNVFWDDIETVLNNYESGEIPQELFDIISELGEINVAVSQEEHELTFSEEIKGGDINGDTETSGVVPEGNVNISSPRRNSTKPSVDSRTPSDPTTVPVDEDEDEPDILELQDEGTDNGDGEPVNDSVQALHSDDRKVTAAVREQSPHPSVPGNMPAEDAGKTASSLNRNSGAERNNGRSSTAKEESDEFEENPREDIRIRLEKEWETRKMAQTHRPAGRVTDSEPYTPQHAEASTASEEQFFGDSGEPVRTGWSAESKTSQRLNRSFTDAKKSAENAQDKVDIMELFNEETAKNKYSFLWFKLLMRMMYSERMKESHREIQITFGEHQVLPGNVMILMMPSKAIPNWISNAEHLSVTVLKYSQRTVNCSVICKTDDAVWVKAGEYDELSTIIPDEGKIRLNADGTTYTFIDALMNRFIQLDYHDSDNIKDNLPSNIQYIYGPPGTGKTYELVKRLKEEIATKDPYRFVLVLTPTNRAADEIADRLVADSFSKNNTFRFGTTDSLDILRNGRLINRDSCINAEEGPNIVITTAARFAYDYLDGSTAICEYPWDAVYFDEASMIDLPTISYALMKLDAGTPIVIAGDPQQIQPVEENDIQPENIYQMVGLNSFAAALRRDDVMGLRLQRRSVPQIGRLVSAFAYDNMLEHQRDDNIEMPLMLDGYKNLSSVNFIGFRTEPLDPVYGIDTVNLSSFHLYSVLLAYNFADYVAYEVEKRGYKDYTIGIVSPFSAQSAAIKNMLENRPLDREGCCTVKCGTVHSFQGSECNTMIVVMNPPTEVTAGSHVNNRNLVNVAISRARDYLFVMVPDHRIDKFWTRELLGNLGRGDGASLDYAKNIENLIFGSENFIERNVNISCHMPVNVYYEPTKLYEVRIDENAVDIQINEGLKEN